MDACVLAVATKCAPHGACRGSGGRKSASARKQERVSQGERATKLFPNGIRTTACEEQSGVKKTAHTWGIQHLLQHIFFKAPYLGEREREEPGFLEHLLERDAGVACLGHLGRVEQPFRQERHDVQLRGRRG